MWETKERKAAIMEENTRKNKHLTNEERSEIENCLAKRMTFKDIGRFIGKDPTTISYEVKHHRIEHKSGFTKIEGSCPLLLKAPFVCNGCSKRQNAGCQYTRFLYHGNRAHKEYFTLLTEAREGIPLNKEEFYEADRIISNGIKDGQHIYHILKTHPEIHESKSTVYRHLHKGYLSISVMELPRAVKFKPRTQKKPEYVPKGIKVGRSYADFEERIQQDQIESFTEMDTVIGRIGGKVIMTIHFTAADFMCGLLLDDKTSVSASQAFSALKNRLRSSGFDPASVMPILLTDNGAEFSDVFSFENTPNGDRECAVYFCDPMKSCQKPQIEKNHTLFRDIVPKGSSFDDFSQETVNLIFSHVNSVKRNLFHGKSAYEMFVFLFSEELAHALGIYRIPDREVRQSPNLLSGIADLKKNME